MADNFLDDFDKFNLDYPEIELETNDLKLVITLKKDYSEIEDVNIRKKQFFKDLEDFIKEFSQTQESDDLMDYYDLENFDKE